MAAGGSMPFPSIMNPSTKSKKFSWKGSHKGFDNGSQRDSDNPVSSKTKISENSNSAKWKSFKSKKFSWRRGSSEGFGEGVLNVPMEAENSNSFTLGASEEVRPEHLVILVNGIVGSAENWRFAAEQFKLKLADRVVVHCSASNSALRTFNGVDVMGHRLAEEVQAVIKATPGVTKISFVAHSLGGLVARYAIGQLYAPPGGQDLLQERQDCNSADGEVPVDDSEEGDAVDVSESAAVAALHGSMAGLEPVNFITVATPHLGSKGNQQLPFLFGFSALEKMAPLMAHWFVGRTGRHLFLSDGDSSHLPLLQRMVSDCKEGKFISALRAFRQRTAYANVVNDHMVGWRTASIRRLSEMPQFLLLLNFRKKITHEPVDPKYPHIVGDEETSPCPVGQRSKEPASDPVEEEMLSGLQQLSWRRVDVSFLGAISGNQAHNTIQVKTQSIHWEGADVIHHILDKHF